MSTPIPIYINARFLTEPLTGLQRWGREILREFDEMLAEGEIDPQRYALRLLSPELPSDLPNYRQLKLRVQGPFRSHVWEQLTLPRLAKGLLFCPKSTAPVRHRNMAVMLHDMQIYATPDTYSRTFIRVYRYILPRAARRARRLMTLSKHSGSEIEKYLHIPAEKIDVILCGHEHALREASDPEILTRHELKPKSFLLAVSSLNPNKNFAAAVRALNRIDLGEIPFVVAGGANPRVFEASDVGRLPAGTRHVGRVSDAELRALYENALGFVFPSFYEGFGLPPLEAMALGCPVISSRMTSLPEVCGSAALYFDPADDADLARQIRRLVDDPPLQHELSAKGRARAAGFRWRECARRLWRALEPLAAGSAATH